MKSILKKSLKASFVALAAIKANDHLHHSNDSNYFSEQYNRARRTFLLRNTSSCEEEAPEQQQPVQRSREYDFVINNNDDLVAKMLRDEFGGDVSRVAPEKRVKFDFQFRTREQHLKDLATEHYDLLIVGGGANGSGVALEAASRGLKCAVIDAYDFASGTSSRSTKMAHGGVRYFEQMMKLEGDPFENYQLLKETLHERNYFLQAAPYQNRQLKLMIPGTFWETLFMYYPGTLLYHLIYLRQLMKSNYEVSVEGPSITFQNKLRKLYPNVTAIQGKCGTLLHESQMMDTRMNLHALLTASVDGFIPGMKGANLANYVEFVDFVKDPSSGEITGAVLMDKLKKKQFTVKSRVVVNCAGVHADEIRKKDDPTTFDRIIGAKGTHLMFREGMIPQDQGIIVPKTKDGRLIFIINYLGATMVGTTDEKTPITHTVKPDQSEIDFIIDELKQVFGNDYDYQGNLLSAWAGIRPLVKETQEDREFKAKFLGIEIDPAKMSLLQRSSHTFKRAVIWFGRVIHNKSGDATKAISRNHVVEFSKSGLVSVMGGKWTTFRQIGEETVDMIMKELKDKKRLEPKYESTQTLKFNYVGAYSRAEAIHGLKQSNEELYHTYEEHMVFVQDIPRECAKHLIHSYGTMALRVVELGNQEQQQKKGQKKWNERIHPDYPFLRSEVLYSIRHEMAEKPNDILCRRMPVGILNQSVALEILPEVVEILAKERKWSNAQKKQELEDAIKMMDYVK